MGSTSNKDENIDIYASINKEYYVAGENIGGQVYLNVKYARTYNSLCLKI